MIIVSNTLSVAYFFRIIITDSFLHRVTERSPYGKMEVAKSLFDILSDEEIARRIQLPLEKVQELRMESN